MTKFRDTGMRIEVNQSNQNHWEKTLKYHVVTGGAGFIGLHIVGAMGFVDWKLAAMSQQVAVASGRARWDTEFNRHEYC
jgi:hypothetical protein